MKTYDITLTQQRELCSSSWRCKITTNWSWTVFCFVYDTDISLNSSLSYPRSFTALQCVWFPLILHLCFVYSAVFIAELLHWHSLPRHGTGATVVAKPWTSTIAFIFIFIFFAAVWCHQGVFCFVLFCFSSAVVHPCCPLRPGSLITPVLQWLIAPHWMTVNQ